MKQKTARECLKAFQEAKDSKVDKETLIDKTSDISEDSISTIKR